MGTADTSQWPHYGGSYNEQRFSPLAAINEDNVASWGWPGMRTMTPTRINTAPPFMWMG